MLSSYLRQKNDMKLGTNQFIDENLVKTQKDDFVSTIGTNMTNDEGREIRIAFNI